MPNWRKPAETWDWRVKAGMSARQRNPAQAIRHAQDDPALQHLDDERHRTPPPVTSEQVEVISQVMLRRYASLIA